MMKKKKLLLLLIPLLILATVFTSAFTQVQTFTIEGILAHDEFNLGREPSGYEEVSYTLLEDPDGRTGYSGQLYICLGGDWVEDGKPVRTDDSGRDKTYEVADYKNEIIALYGKDIYQKALASGQTLVYDSSRGKPVIHSEKDEKLDVTPCKDGDKAYFYNNLDFYLKLAFTVDGEQGGSKLTIIPPEQSIYVGEQAQYRAIWTENGEETDVTELSTWKSMNTNLATSDGNGKFMGTSKGSLTVTAVYNNRSQTAYLNVLENGEPIPEPGDPEKEPNSPPVAVIDAPEEVEVGEDFCIRSKSYDSDGYIVFHDWYVSGDLELDKNDEEGWTETTENKCGVYFEDEGEYEIELQVTDDAGSSDDTTHTIKVTPPKPDARFQVKGHFKEDRDLTFDTTSTGSKYSAIDWSKSYVEVSAVDSKNDEHIRIYLGGEHVGKGTFYDTKEFDLLFRKTGDYKITHYVVNKHGLSDKATGTFFIEPDLPPVAEIETSPIVYMNPKNLHSNFPYTDQTIYGKATSPDGDVIEEYIYSVTYDSNNDGEYEDDEPVVHFSSNEMVVGKTYDYQHPEFPNLEIFASFDNNYNLNFETPYVGKYHVLLTAVEGWNNANYTTKSFN